ncbi:MAG: hypothetical protein E7208_00195 [Clostridium butyricum]|nr:hypothetical protein [Clostridium butyricum]
MNRNALKIIALALSISAISASLPSAMSINTTTAMAADVEGIDSLHVCKGDSSTSLTLYKDSNFKNSTKFKDSINKYYVKLPESTGKFNIDVDTESGYSVEISEDGDEYDSGDVISVSKGSSANVKVKVYDEDDSIASTITIRVTRAGEDSSDSDDEDDDYDDIYDDIYLDDIKIKSDEGKVDFSFDRNKTKFSVDVEEDIDNVTIVAEPDNDDDTVRINGTRVTDDDDYERDINLNVGNNTIKVTVKNDDKDERQYTINIKRAGKTTNTTTIDGKTSATGINISDSSFYDYGLGITNSSYVGYVNETNNAKNQWVKTGLNWQYFDANGKALRNQWFKDTSNGKWYYFQTNAYMTTGWRFIEGSWYYFDKTGYMLSNKWMKDTNEKWYYFLESGEMAKSTTIDGYRINARGEMVEE